MPVYALGEHVPVLPSLGEFWIAPDAHVIGKVVLGRDVGLWFGAVLRGDNELIMVGDRTNVQEGVILHTDIGFPLTIGRGCTIGHHAIVHGCTIGDDVLIGMGATVMNGARIGDGCIIGAGALVTEHKVFEPRTLVVGSPAKPIRRLADGAIDDLRRSATHYIATWRRFQAELKRLD